jgi:hypothetical protein
MTQIKRPNIFKVSTKELSQDAFITWLLQWANPQCAQLCSILHACGRDFLLLVMNKTDGKIIERVEAGRQWENVDVWAEVFFTDGSKTLIVIEDKTFSGQHSNQLERYKMKAEDYCIKNGYNLICTYFKIGSEPLKTLNEIKRKGFNIVTRLEIRMCLQPYRDAEHSILQDFIEYIDELEAAHVAFESRVPKDWSGLAWVGFYQFVESNISVNGWHRVNNPSGGFWNLCLTWAYWNEHIPVYMQIEEHKLCYKIALGEDETGFSQRQIDLNGVQDYVFNFLMAYAKRHGNLTIKRPSRFVRRGNYRTLAIINLKDWCSNPEQLLDKKEILNSINDIISFYRHFMIELNTMSFDSAGIAVYGTQNLD